MDGERHSCEACASASACAARPRHTALLPACGRLGGAQSPPPLLSAAPSRPVRPPPPMQPRSARVCDRTRGCRPSADVGVDVLPPFRSSFTSSLRAVNGGLRRVACRPPQFFPCMVTHARTRRVALSFPPLTGTVMSDFQQPNLSFRCQFLYRLRETNIIRRGSHGALLVRVAFNNE